MRGTFVLLLVCGCVGDSSSPADASSDSTLVDTGADAGVDTGVDAGTSFCTGKSYAFCADFDLVSAPEIGWSLGKSEKLGGTVGLDQTSYVSAPLSMNAKIPAFSGGAAYTYLAALGHVIDLKGNATARMTLDTYPKNVAFLSGDCVTYLGMQLNGIGGIILMERRLPDAGAAEWLVYRTMMSSSFPHFMPSGLSTNKWNHVVMEVRWANDTTGSMKLTIDGVAVLDVPNIMTTQETISQTVRLTVGLNNCSGSAQATSVSYDNVFAEILP